MRASRFLFVVAVMMVVAAVVIPVLTAPAEQAARGVRQALAVRLDSLTGVRGRADSVEMAARIDSVRTALAEADDHLASVTEGRRRYWSLLGAGTILVGFAVVLGIGGVLARRW